MGPAVPAPETQPKAGWRLTIQGGLQNPRALRVARGIAALLLFYFVQQKLWPAPAGVLVQGIVVGGLTALIAFGLSMVYRANRIINFAQGDLGALPAVLAVLLIVGPRWPYFVAMPIGILAGLVLGGLVEFLFIRRFFKAPRLVLTVVTIGVAQLLAGFGLLLPKAFDLTIPPQSFPSPFDFSFTIHPIVFRGNDIIAMLAVPLAIGGIAAFFRYTNVGIAIRASAEGADRAALLGIPVKRIQTVVWMVAAVLSTVAMLLRAGIVGLPIGSVLGPEILLRALAAGVIGRMERMSTMLVASLAIGIVEQAVVWHTGKGVLVAPVLFAVILGALLVQRRQKDESAEEQSSWQATSAVRPIPRELARLPEVRNTVWGLRWAGVGALLLLPLALSGSQVNLVAAILIYAMVGTSLVVLTGWAGQVSLGQMAFVGAGAAVAGAITSRVGWDLWVSILLAGLAGALVALLIGLPALRIRGLYLAVTTLAFALTASHYLLNRSYFSSWLPTDRVPRPLLFGRISVESEVRYYYLTVVVFLGVLAAVKRVRGSRTGRVLISTRDNERASESFGINLTRAKLTAFGLSGFLAAVAGALFVHHQQALDQGVYFPAESLVVFSMVVIGGLGSIPGAVVGAFYVRGVTWFLPPAFRFFTNGFGLVIVLLLLPGGLGSLVYQLRDILLRRVAARRGILVPSLVADSRDEQTILRSREDGLASVDFVTQSAVAAPAGDGASDVPARLNGDGGAASSRSGRASKRPVARS